MILFAKNAKGWGTSVRGLDGSPRLEADRQNVKHEQQFPAQHEDGNHSCADGEHFSKGHGGAAGFEAAGDQAEDIQRGETEDGGPEQVVKTAAATDHGLEKNRAGRHESGVRRNNLVCAILHELAVSRQVERLLRGLGRLAAVWALPAESRFSAAAPLGMTSLICGVVPDG